MGSSLHILFHVLVRAEPVYIFSARRIADFARFYFMLYYDPLLAKSFRTFLHLGRYGPNRAQKHPRVADSVRKTHTHVLHAIKARNKVISTTATSSLPLEVMYRHT